MTIIAAPHRISLGEFASVFVACGILLIAALMVPELTDAVIQNRIAYTIWLSTLLLIPGFTLYIFAAQSQPSRNISLLFMTAAYVSYMFHFYYATFVVFGGIAGIFHNMRLLIALVNVLVTIWWSIDTVCAWLTFRSATGTSRIRTTFYCFLFLVFVVTDVGLRPTFVRYIGLALAASVILALLIKIGARNHRN
jgi:hypothetical protein